MNKAHPDITKDVQNTAKGFVTISDVAPRTHRLRIVKSPAEISIMKKVVSDHETIMEEETL